MRANIVGHVEVLVRIPAHYLFSRADLVLAEWRAVGAAGALLLRRWVTDDRTDPHQRGAVLFLDRTVYRALHLVKVVDVLDVLDVPAVGLEALRRVFLVAERGGAVERDVVVVVAVDEPVKLQVTS